MWPLLQQPDVFDDCISLMASYIHKHCDKVDVIVGLESRGFVFGPMIAQKLKTAFVPIRKAGKLPGETVKVMYKLEYGEVGTFHIFMVPTRTGKPGKMGKPFPVREKSGNFEETRKVWEFYPEYWENSGILA